MATVTFNRGGSTKLNSISNTDGMIYFNSDDLCIYVDNGTTREIYGGVPPFVTRKQDATASNLYAAATVNNLFCLKKNVADTISAIDDNKTTSSIPVGCKGFVSAIGEDADYNYEDRTTVKGHIGNLKNRLKVDDNEFVFGYYNNQWGFYTSETRGADTFHPFNSTQATMLTTWTTESGTSIINEIHDNRVDIFYKTTTSTSEKALTADDVAGTCASRIAYVGSNSGDMDSDAVIHLFYDQYGLSASGNHNHYIYTLKSKTWHTLSGDTNKSPVGFVSGAICGQPFVLTHDEIWDSSETYQSNDLYFFVATNRYLKIYRWVDSNTNLWSGSWSLISSSEYSLPSGRSYSQVGGYRSVVVHNNELHILGGFYGTNHTIDRNHYIWNPNSGWRIDGTLIPSGVLHYRTDIDCGLKGCVSHNKKIWCFTDNNDVYTFDGSTWTNVDHVGIIIDYASFIEYNGQIHMLGGGGNTTEKKRHGIYMDGEGYIDTTICPALSYPFWDGCACLLPTGYIAPSTSASPHFYNIALSPTSIHYMGTSQANATDNAYRKKHYSLVDSYNVHIYNS